MPSQSLSLDQARRWVRLRLARLARELDLEHDAVQAEVVGAQRMRTLNQQYRGKDSVTDVLSFSAPPLFTHRLGDLVLCLPVAARQAKREGHSVHAELDILIVHGVLHLQGWDHEGSLEMARKMARRERDLLKKVFRRKIGLIDRTQGG